MSKHFKSAGAFKTSLETRLKKLALERGLPLHTLRLKVVIERLLARLFHSSEAPWLLKGGFAMELRFRPRARTTKDVDLSLNPRFTFQEKERHPERLRERLQEAVEIDLGDHLEFRIGTVQSEIEAAPLGGARFPCDARLFGMSYAKFHIDLGCGDAVIGDPERLLGEGLLQFAGIQPPVIFAIPRAQQFAEKMHAYSLPRANRTNTRSKDLVDLILFLETGLPASDIVRTALEATFTTRNTHPLPQSLPLPPESWKTEFAAMAEEARLPTLDFREGFTLLERYWQRIFCSEESE